jgi:hypothetical protein
MVNSNVEKMFEIDQESWIGEKFEFLFSSFKLSNKFNLIEAKECILIRSNSTELCLEIHVNELKNENIKIITLKDISVQKKNTNEKNNSLSPFTWPNPGLFAGNGRPHPLPGCKQLDETDGTPRLPQQTAARKSGLHVGQSL